MRNTLRMINVLTLIGLVSGLSLVFMYKYASPLIAENQKKDTGQAVFKIFTAAKSYDKEMVKENVVFKVKDKNGNFLGYAFLAEGSGYQGSIKLMAGVKPDLETLVGIEILEAQETPGLGQEITSDKFKSQFHNLKTTPEITYVKNQPPSKPNEILAVTGATISSRAVVTILNERLKTLKEKFKK